MGKPLTPQDGAVLKAFVAIWQFYKNGFKQMTVGRTLWKIILIKLLIMFAVLKFFFFPNYLHTQFDTDQQRADHVTEQLTRSAQSKTH